MVVSVRSGEAHNGASGSLELVVELSGSIAIIVSVSLREMKGGFNFVV